jgi:putative transposase
MGPPQDPRRAGRPGSQGRGVDRMGDRQDQRHRPGAAASRPDLAAVPTFSAETILACDFFIVDLLDGTQAHVLAVIEHATRRIRILGVTPHPTGEWTAQRDRNLLMDLGDQARRAKFMIRDRGSNFTTAFDTVLADAGTRTVLCNVAMPRMNAIAERWIGGCRELLDRALIWNQAHLRQILNQYETHHNQHRPHRFLHGAAPLKPLPEPVGLEQYRVRRRARVAGLINEYRLVA